MYGINIVILAGRVGKDPQYREFSNGGAVTNLSLATSKRGYKTRDGREVKEQTEWHNLVFHDALAKMVRDHVKKGAQIHVQGELRTRNYTDKSGITQYVTEVHVNDMQFLDNGSGYKDSSKEDTTSTENNNNNSTEESNTPPVIDNEFQVENNIVFGGTNGGEDEEDLPF